MSDNQERNPHRCIVDSVGNYVEFVKMTDLHGNWLEEPDGRPLADGEQLVDIAQPTIGRGGFVKARLADGVWVEAATEEEIAAWEAANPAPEPAPLTQAELLAVEFSTALAAIRLETDLGLAEMTTLLAAGMEG